MALKPDNRMTAEQYRRYLVEGARAFDEQTATKRHKYGAERTIYVSPLVGERAYPSKLQADYAAFLDACVAHGSVLWWLPEVPIPLAAQSESGRQRHMRVDFLVCDSDGRVQFVDAKGMATKDWELKRDIVKARYGIAIGLATRDGIWTDVWCDIRSEMSKATIRKTYQSTPD